MAGAQHNAPVDAAADVVVVAVAAADVAEAAAVDQHAAHGSTESVVLQGHPSRLEVEAFQGRSLYLAYSAAAVEARVAIIAAVERQSQVLPAVAVPLLADQPLDAVLVRWQTADLAVTVTPCSPAVVRPAYAQLACRAVHPWCPF